MYVNSSGNVTIHTITGGWSAAQCFTSLFTADAQPPRGAAERRA